jgi:hypothetical protein
MHAYYHKNVIESRLFPIYLIIVTPEPDRKITGRVALAAGFSGAFF